jgi:glucokinase
MTNLAWDLNEAELCRGLGLARVTLLNDLNAVAHAIPHLKSEQLVDINPGKAKLHGAIAVMAPGTGLGEAFLIWSGTAYVACPSEGGHRDFAPANEVQAGLWSYLTDRFRHVAYERLPPVSACKTFTTTSAPAILRRKAPPSSLPCRLR